ncbi:hypothetical protein DICVIV_04508 [Dictyocaulus viviparus]|uniref:BHLH domain-containing protein n=1 Tax=Dictyocaulus viviparus TaxID=29172 RepID=A0A0D8XXJ1_DICVI|nr:hypothetical protein DICVIV_04508 [Dictyocaulus viviparus]
MQYLQSSGHAKWEKADILEMTVDYLKKLRTLRDPTGSFCAGGPLETMPHRAKTCDSNPTSTAPSPSSAESTPDGPTSAKRRRDTSPNPSATHDVGTFRIPQSSTLHTLQAIPTTRIPSLTSNLRPPNNYNFITQHLLAIQYQQNLKMAAMTPGILPTITPVHPFATVTAIPWRSL